KRVDAQRVLAVTANIVPELTNVNKVRRDLEANVFPVMMQNYPGLTYSYGGRQQEQSDAMHSLMVGFAVSLAVIFGMLAAIYRSYGQAIVSMLVIPFAVGAALL